MRIYVCLQPIASFTHHQFSFYCTHCSHRYRIRYTIIWMFSYTIHIHARTQTCADVHGGKLTQHRRSCGSQCWRSELFRSNIRTKNTPKTSMHTNKMIRNSKPFHLPNIRRFRFHQSLIPLEAQLLQQKSNQQFSSYQFQFYL